MDKFDISMVRGIRMSEQEVRKLLESGYKLKKHNWDRSMYIQLIEKPVPPGIVKSVIIDEHGITHPYENLIIEDFESWQVYEHEYISNLKSFLSLKGKFRPSMIEILDDMYEVWDKLCERDKLKIIEMLGLK